MDDLLDQIDDAVAAGLNFLAVCSAFTVPDICGALESPTGEATGRAYRRWWNENVRGYEDYLPAENAWAFRCSLLHQGSGWHHKKRESRLVLIESTANYRADRIRLGSGDARQVALDAATFARTIVGSARTWLGNHADNPVVQANLARTIRRTVDGPLVSGLPTIG